MGNVCTRGDYFGETSAAPAADLQVDIVLYSIFKFHNIATLIRLKQVCKQWRDVINRVIQDKYSTCQAFNDHRELMGAIHLYCCHYNRQEEFEKEIALTYGYPIDKWDVPRVTNFSHLLSQRRNFNEPIGSWDVSNATKMFGMFYNANSFNQDLSNWETSNVVDMGFMFANSKSFNQDISTWNVSNVTNMRCMFYNARSFNQDISTWDVSRHDDCVQMFKGASSFSFIIPFSSKIFPLGINVYDVLRG